MCAKRKHILVAVSSLTRRAHGSQILVSLKTRTHTLATTFCTSVKRRGYPKKMRRRIRKLADALTFPDLLSIGHGDVRGALEMLLLDKEPPIKLAGLTMAVVSAKDDLGSANQRLPRGSFVSFECFEALSGDI